MLPYTCDALAPDEFRYSSIRYRRFARHFTAWRVDADDAVELVAFVRVIGEKAARMVFHWDTIRQYRRLTRRRGIWEGSEPLYQQNLASLSYEDGLALLRAMQVGGYKKGPVPEFIKMSLRELRKRGYTRAQIAEMTNLTGPQVAAWLNPPKRRATSRVRATASLSI